MISLLDKFVKITQIAVKFFLFPYRLIGIRNENNNSRDFYCRKTKEQNIQPLSDMIWYSWAQLLGNFLLFYINFNKLKLSFVIYNHIVTCSCLAISKSENKTSIYSSICLNSNAKRSLIRPDHFLSDWSQGGVSINTLDICCNILH